MTESIAFILGLFTMGFLWFMSDLFENPYQKGYKDGYENALEDERNKK